MRGPQGSNVTLMSPSACNQCGQDLPNLDEVRSEIAEYIKQLHSQLCTGSSGEDRVRVARQLTAGGTEGTSASLSAAFLQPPQNAVAPKSSAPTKRKKYETDTMERKAILEADIWGRDVAPRSITCRGCNKTIKLDKRNEYYPGLWVKHRDKCREILISQGVQIPLKEPRKKPASKSTDRVMGVEDTTPVARETSNVTARTEEAGMRSASRVRAFSPYSRSSTRSTSSSIGSSIATASTHRSRVEVARSLRMGTAAPPPERRELDYGARPVTRSPPARVHSGGTHYTQYFEPSIGTATPPQERREFDYGARPVTRSPSARVPSGGTRSARYTQNFEPSIGTATPPPERREFDYGARPVSRSSPAGVPSENIRSARYTHNDEPSTSDREYTLESHGERHVGSDRYWSEAPFDGDSGQSRTGLYRYSTRWELMHVFPGMHGQGYENDDSDEEMSPVSP